MVSKRLTLLGWLLVPVLLIGQVSNVDSLEQILASQPHDTVQLPILEKLLEYYIESDLDKSESISYRLLSTANRANQPRYACMAYYFQGIVHRKSNLEIDTIIGTFEEALACFEAVGDDESLGKVYNQMGGVYQRKGHSVQAMSHFQQALEIAEARQDTLAMIPSIANMALVLKVRLDYDKSLEYSERALVYAERINHPLYIAMITNNIANIYYNRGIFDTALDLYEKALAIKREKGSELSLIITLANMGGIHTEQGRYRLGHQYLDEAYALSQKLKYPYGEWLSMRYMVNSAYLQGQYEKAIQLAHQALELGGKDRVDTYTMDFYDVIGNSYEGLNQLDSAIHYLKVSQSKRDSIFQLETEQQVHQLEIRYQVEQKEMENDLLKTEQAFIQQELANRTYLSIGLIIALFLAFGWGVAVYRANQAKKQMNSLLEAQVAERTANLQVANKQLKQVNYELQTFNYIASHDLKEPIRNIANYVSLIFRRIPDVEKEGVKEYFDIIHQSTHQLYTLIEDFASYSALSREESSRMHEVNLQTLIAGVETGLRSFIEENHGLLIYGELPCIFSNSSLLFVALKNLIENGIKFNQSEVPTVTIDYQSSPTHHQIHVSDNGIGIDPHYHEQIFVMFKRLHNRTEYQGSGNGLAIVKLIAEKLDGEVWVQSKPEQGSTFILSFPK